VLIPTGAVEQHGPHLPLMTDALIVEEIANSSEQRLPDSVLLTPTLWLGASAQHLAFAGTLSASFASYQSSLRAVIDSLSGHGFHTFFVLNGHGGNSDANRIVLRELKEAHPNFTLAHAAYYDLIEREISESLLGPSKRMTHGCEAETSLVLHLRPELVRLDSGQKDGLRAEPPIEGLVVRFEQLSHNGSIGYPGFATVETGSKLFAAAVAAVCIQLERMANPYVMVEI